MNIENKEGKTLAIDDSLIKGVGGGCVCVADTSICPTVYMDRNTSIAAFLECVCVCVCVCGAHMKKKLIQINKYINKYKLHTDV